MFLMIRMNLMCDLSSDKTPTFRVPSMFLSDFTESKIELSGCILIIDGKRYINRGLWLVRDIDVKNRLVFKEGQTHSLLFENESVPFDEVQLIPLFTTNK